MFDSATSNNSNDSQPATSQIPVEQHSIDLKDTLRLINACLTAIERSAWQLRGMANHAQKGWKWLKTETSSIWEETRRLPARLKRLGQCGWMLTRLLSSYRLWPTRKAFISTRQQEAALQRLHRKNARLFVATSLSQGGAFLKIGQLLSTRSDLLPPIWITELSRLQDHAEPEPTWVIEKAIKTALGQPADTLFASFDKEPLAAASIGQVHKAKLDDGRTVAVKIQRPDMAELIETDLLLLGLFLGNVESMLPDVDLATIFKEIKRTLREELNYQHEADAMRHVGEQARQLDGVFCPAVIDSLSNERVLVTEFIEGRKLTDALDSYQQDNDSNRTAQLMTRLLDAWLFQVLQLGFFNADPHPGNLLVTQDNQLVLLDFGACQQLSDSARRHYLRILQASIVGDDGTIADSLDKLGFRTRSGNPDTLLAFAHTLLTQLSERLSELPASGNIWPDEDELLEEGQALFQQLEADPVETLPPDFIMLARVFLSLGGLFIHYRPPMDLAALVLKHLTWPQPTAA